MLWLANISYHPQQHHKGMFNLIFSEAQFHSLIPESDSTFLRSFRVVYILRSYDIDVSWLHFLRWNFFGMVLCVLLLIPCFIICRWRVWFMLVLHYRILKISFLELISHFKFICPEAAYESGPPTRLYSVFILPHILNSKVLKKSKFEIQLEIA